MYFSRACCKHFSPGWNSSQTPNNFPPLVGLWYVRNLEAVVDKHEAYIEMRLKVEAVFERYAAQSEYYKRANIVQRFAMEDAFYRLSMELLARIIGPFDVMR
jgi:hypothetical protein